MILLFLGFLAVHDHRHDLSIPLSILVSIIILWSLGETLNVMTLGGMALAVGILVDDATVEIENIHRNLHQRKRLVQAILDGASQIAVPAFVSTLCICIVFVPVVFITGAAKYLFTPLAMAVVFAMMTSYLLSRTLVPTMVHYLLAAEVEMYGGVLDEERSACRCMPGMSSEAHAHGQPVRSRRHVTWRADVSSLRIPGPVAGIHIVMRIAADRVCPDACARLIFLIPQSYPGWAACCRWFRGRLSAPRVGCKRQSHVCCWN